METAPRPNLISMEGMIWNGRLLFLYKCYNGVVNGVVMFCRYKSDPPACLILFLTSLSLACFWFFGYDDYIA